MSKPPSLDVEVADPDLSGSPLLIIIDGLDEYDVGDTTVALAAARLVEHAEKAVNDWQLHNKDVRLLLCGRPEAASALTAQFRKKFHHLNVTGFVHRQERAIEPESEKSRDLLQLDQRDLWWRNWQRASGKEIIGIPDAIKNSQDDGVLEITSQPLLNYMIAVLKLHEGEKISSLSDLYSNLFSRYYDRQVQGKFSAFVRVCPDLKRFRRIMSEIGLAAWHAGDRSVGTIDLKARFDRPPLKRWLEAAGEAGRGLSAILSAFYTRPEESVSPDGGLAQRYVFTHKSFREYLTAVGTVRFLEELSSKLDPETDDGWSDSEALTAWLEFFGPTALDGRQFAFIEDELRSNTDYDRRFRILGSICRLFELVLARAMPFPQVESASQAFRMVGNAEEAFVLILSAILNSSSLSDRSSFYTSGAQIRWPETDSSARRYELFEFLHRVRV